MDTESPVIWPAWCYSGDTAATNGTEDSSPSHSHSHIKSRKRRIPDRMNCANDYISHNNNNNNNSISNNNNNPVKNERLSPGTPDTLSRSRSVTPSSASYPGTPPSSGETLAPTGATVGVHPHHGLMPLAGRNYSDFMRSLAAKYNNTNPNDYRNGFASLKGHGGVTPTPSNTGKDDASSPSPSPKKPEYPASSLAAAAALLNPFASPVFPPLIDMSTTQTLLAMVRTAKEAEIQGFLKTSSNTSIPQTHPQPTQQQQNSNKRNHNFSHQSSLSELSSSPLDLSAAGTPIKRARVKTPNSGKNSDTESPKPMQMQHHHHHDHDPMAIDDLSSWSVEDVCNFVASIDICSEYVQKFREQRIDGAGLPLLTEEHLTTTIQMKLGPALKLRSMLAKKLGSCTICLHCVHCHTSSSPTNTPPPPPSSTTVTPSSL